MRRIALLACVALACLSSATAQAGPLRLQPLHAEPDAAGQGRIVDSQRREVLLRGVNVNSLAQYAQPTPFPAVLPLEARDPARMAAIGWNTVRLLVSWSRLEPSPGAYDDKYLEWIASTTKSLRARGIYTIIDFHQDAWGASLQAGSGQSCGKGEAPNVGFDGAPQWATIEGPLPRCFLGIRELSLPVVNAWQSFLKDSPGPGGVGIQTRYVKMVGHVARRFAKAPAIAGYDVVNEPNAYGATALSQLSNLYARVFNEVRHAERDGGGFPHLLFIEPTVAGELAPDFARDRNVVYAPHVYGGDEGITRPAFEGVLAAARTYGGAPVMAGEWGARPDRAALDQYFTTHQGFQDEFRMGAALWTWRQSCGDPSKMADWRAGRIPVTWGLFEVDCRTNEPAGVRGDLALQLTRAYVRAAPGRLTGQAYDDATGAFAAWGTRVKGAGELVLFFPKAKHGGVRVASTGLGALKMNRAPGGAVLVSGRAVAPEWSIAAGGPRASTRALRARAARVAEAELQQ